MTKLIQVKKRDGSTENFEDAKIIRVVKAAGLTQIEAQRLAKDVRRWIKNHFESTITSVQIRNKVSKELNRVNPYAAGLYAWYQKLKEREALRGSI